MGRKLPPPLEALIREAVGSRRTQESRLAQILSLESDTCYLWAPATDIAHKYPVGAQLSRP